jgi:hypothetical protein
MRRLRSRAGPNVLVMDACEPLHIMRVLPSAMWMRRRRPFTRAHGCIVVFKRTRTCCLPV